MRMTGIGDPHFDGKLSEHIPNFNEVVGNEIRLVLEKSRRQGSKVVLLYGDICERFSLSDNARKVLLGLFKEFEDLNFIMWRGNHDTLGPQSTEPCSLDPFHDMIELGYIKNLRVVRHQPQDFFTNTDHPIRILPWPFKDSLADRLNFMHVEIAGSTWETGHAVDSTYSTKHLCAIGHIHTAQRVRNSHFSGTLYQTTFGESEEKFYHDIQWDGDVREARIKLVPHFPKYTLKNVMIRSSEEYVDARARIKEAPDTTLWKAFINSKKLVLPVNAFDDLPTVIKHNPYKSKEELVSLIHEEITMDDRSSSVSQDTDAALNQWMEKHGIEADLQERARTYLSTLLTPK